MEKLTEKEYEEYWKNIHKKKMRDDLNYVCFPDKPRYFNRFHDRMQKWILKKYIKTEKVYLNNKKLLDVGCGRGRWIRFFEMYGADVKGIDLSEEAGDYCRQKGMDVYTGSIDNMDMFAEEQFDIVTSITVLLHLPYNIKEHAIQEIGRVIKKGGRVILLENTWEDTAPHVYSYGVDEWCEIFKKYDMEMIHCSAHCFNFCRRKFPCYIKWIEAVAIYIDYLLDFIGMNLSYGKRSKLSLQHFMVFEKKD